MNNRLTVQYALLCLKELDGSVQSGRTALQLSRTQGIPLPECQTILRQLAAAGIVGLRATGEARLQRPAAELTALEVLQALQTAPAPEFRLLYQSQEGLSAKHTREAVASAAHQAAYPGEGSVVVETAVFVGREGFPDFEGPETNGRMN